MATKYRVGGEIDAYCGKDKMELAHTIIAMVGDKVARVQCNTCGSQHAFRGTAAPAPKAPRASAGRSPAEPRASKVTVTFDQLMAQRDASTAKRYSVKETFAKDDLIDHPTFGYGIVLDARPDKVTVLFKMDEKVLVHGRGGAPGAKPAFGAPKAPATEPADRPLDEAADATPGLGEENPSI
ncbi:MAG: hypothetical protein IRZ16_09600 [Myxococcaceae bacterium]|nr:hypothetical protein [Myxococcaceae bacterium]